MNLREDPGSRRRATPEDQIQPALLDEKVKTMTGFVSLMADTKPLNEGEQDLIKRLYEDAFKESQVSGAGSEEPS